MTIEPEPLAPVTPPPPAAQPAFRVGLLILGLVTALMIGGGGNIISGLVGASTNAKFSAALIGAIPGALFALLSLVTRKDGLSQGFLIGGCIIGLIGGACGASLVGMSFH